MLIAFAAILPSLIHRRWSIQTSKNTHMNQSLENSWFKPFLLVKGHGYRPALYLMILHILQGLFADIAQHTIVDENR